MGLHTAIAVIVNCIMNSLTIPKMILAFIMYTQYLPYFDSLHISTKVIITANSCNFDTANQ